jgi:hypothetical protein
VRPTETVHRASGPSTELISLLRNRAAICIGSARGACRRRGVQIALRRRSPDARTGHNRR